MTGLGGAQQPGQPVELVLVNVGEAAKRLSISPRTLWKLTKDGAIKARRVGKRVLYSVAELKRFADGANEG